ncbi:MAG: bacillithiol system protein YtxJ [Saprospiraceae bacterium]|jgi:bacillithiol system protein YtxJ
MINWKKLESTATLDSIIEDSFNAPQVIFKHSTSCPISGMAKRRLEGEWELEVSPYYLDLLSYRSISNAIEDKLSVIHESPQIILIVDGKVLYDESHLDISASSLQEILNAHING